MTQNTLVLALICTIAFSYPSICKAEDSPKKLTPANAHKKETEDLPNFHEVHPYLYRSGEPTKQGLLKLKEMGFKTLIDLRAPSEQKFDEKAEAAKLDLKYIRMVMTSAPPTKEQVKTLLDEINKAKSDPANEKVLVHCAHGSDRTGCMIGIWRVSQEDWSYEDAYKEMRKYWFTPKFVKLSGAVKEHAKAQ
ncbi:MAG: tyrosine-protein phosphatase [Cyanobacteria bacterium TGS_CYA1]|nr:tyrosine-protein phosphatase [Cyanobacteria bacterium TGS_CYA1]